MKSPIKMSRNHSIRRQSRQTQSEQTHHDRSRNKVRSDCFDSLKKRSSGSSWGYHPKQQQPRNFGVDETYDAKTDTGTPVGNEEDGGVLGCVGLSKTFQSSLNDIGAISVNDMGSRGKRRRHDDQAVKNLNSQGHRRLVPTKPLAQQKLSPVQLELEGIRTEPSTLEFKQKAGNYAQNGRNAKAVQILSSLAKPFQHESKQKTTCTQPEGWKKDIDVVTDLTQPSSSSDDEVQRGDISCKKRRRDMAQALSESKRQNGVKPKNVASTQNHITGCSGKPAYANHAKQRDQNEQERVRQKHRQISEEKEAAENKKLSVCDVILSDDDAGPLGAHPELSAYSRLGGQGLIAMGETTPIDTFYEDGDDPIDDLDSDYLGHQFRNDREIRGRKSDHRNGIETTKKGRRGDDTTCRPNSADSSGNAKSSRFKAKQDALREKSQSATSGDSFRSVQSKSPKQKNSEALLHFSQPYLRSCHASDQSSCGAQSSTIKTRSEMHSDTSNSIANSRPNLQRDSKKSFHDEAPTPDIPPKNTNLNPRHLKEAKKSDYAQANKARDGRAPGISFTKAKKHTSGFIDQFPSAAKRSAAGKVIVPGSSFSMEQRQQVRGKPLEPGRSFRKDNEHHETTQHLHHPGRERDESPRVAAKELIGKRRPGSRSVTKRNKGPVIELLSDEEEAAGTSQAYAPSNPEKLGGIRNNLESNKLSLDVQLSALTESNSRKPSSSLSRKTRSRILLSVVKDVLKISVGTKTFVDGCRIEFANKTFTLKATKRKDGLILATIDMSDTSVVLKYFLSGEEASLRRQQLHPPFLSMSVEPSRANRLEQYPNVYDKNSRDNKRNCVVVKFRTDTDLNEVIECMERSLPRAPFERLTTISAARLSYGALHDHDEEATEANAINALIAGRGDDKVLLVYPFAGDSKQIEEAAAGLPEASGDLFGQSAPPATGLDYHDGQHLPVEADRVDFLSTSQSALRRHFLTIQVRDLKRLKPREFLNDTLIDFWIQWITRNAHQDPLASQVHCFSSHFFTTLVDEGPDGVRKWTARKKINVFEKKFVFIPINEDLHWSLCVVVNPGSIVDDGEDADMACLILLDSLKFHRKKKVSQQVRKWLNFEWQQINNGKGKPFGDERRFPLFDPKVPYQNNSWDCGVFVCRYAYSVYALRDCDFRRHKQWFAEDLTRLEQFQFNVDDIARLRRDIKTLIQRLSGIFLPWKKEQECLAKQAIRDVKEATHRTAVTKVAQDLVPSDLADPATDAAGSEANCATNSSAQNGGAINREHLVGPPGLPTGWGRATEARHTQSSGPSPCAGDDSTDDDHYSEGRPNDGTTMGHKGQVEDNTDAPAEEIKGARWESDYQHDNMTRSIHVARVSDISKVAGFRENEVLSHFCSPRRQLSNGDARRDISTPSSCGSLTFMTGEAQTDNI